MVTPSDEAFVWQVMTFYYPIWVENDRGQLHSQGTKSGPKKGFNQTTGKTMKTFRNYLQAVGSSRSACNSKMWSGRLKYLAHKKVREDMQRNREERDSEILGCTEMEQDMGFLKYAKLRLCGFDKESGDDSNSETVADSSVDSTLTEEV